ncbi:MAG: cytochrome c [Magnetococcus sp. DMHC-6]
MKKSIWFIHMLTLIFAFGTLSSGWSEEEKKTVPEEPGLEVFHFGNMGGLLPTLTEDMLPDSKSEGAKLIFDLCSQCHNSPGPGLHIKEDWKNIFWRMNWRMHLMNAQFKSFRVPTYAQSHIMLQYLMDHAIKPLRSNMISDKDENAQVFNKVCMQCHTLPDPAQHQADSWSATVARMKGHMQSMGRYVPSDEEIVRILTFLKANAGKDP